MEGHSDSSLNKHPAGGRVVPDRVSYRTKERTMHRDFLRAQAACEIDHPEIFHLLSETIDTIDFDTLHEIFEAYAVRSGVDRGRMNFVPRDQIFIVNTGKDKDESMGYIAQSNVIRVNAQFFADRAKQTDAHTVRVECLKDLMHEYTHATGAIRYIEAPSLDTHSTTLKRMSGIEVDFYSTHPTLQSTDRDSVSLRVFALFNEGITERISHEVLLEYLQRSGTSTYADTDRAEPMIISDMHDDTTIYGAARTLVMALTTALAQQLSLPEVVIWRGLVRQYYSGEMKSYEIMDLLNDAFGDDFGRTLMSAKTAEDIRDLAHRTPSIKAEWRGAALQWLRHLEQVRGAH